MSHTIGPVPVIADSTAAIESAFLSAGQGLSLGLSAIRSLTDGLGALAADLDGGGTAAASRDLGRLSQTLRVIGERLPADGATLTDLLAENKGMGLRFDDLIDDMRMMVVVSRSARLEAVTSAEQRASLEAFSHTIDRQIGEVQRKITACSAETRPADGAAGAGRPAASQLRHDVPRQARRAGRRTRRGARVDRGPAGRRAGLHGGCHPALPQHRPGGRPGAGVAPDRRQHPPAARTRGLRPRRGRGGGGRSGPGRCRRRPAPARRRGPVCATR